MMAAAGGDEEPPFPLLLPAAEAEEPVLLLLLLNSKEKSRLSKLKFLVDLLDFLVVENRFDINDVGGGGGDDIDGDVDV